MPQAKDTGAKYKEHVVSTGPYKFETNELGKSFTLVRNDHWDQATDPNRKALPDTIESRSTSTPTTSTTGCISGDLDVDVAGTGVQPATQGRGPGDPEPEGARRQRRSRRGSGSPSINADVAPLTTSTAARP